MEKPIRTQTGNSDASYLFHGALTRPDSYASELGFCGLLKAIKDLIARMTASQMSLSLISISPLPWDCLYSENMECTSFRFSFLLDSMTHAFTAPFLLPGVSKGILSRYLFLVNTVLFFTMICLRNLLALTNVCEGNLDTSVICPSEYLTIFQQLTRTHTHPAWRFLKSCSQFTFTK